MIWRVGSKADAVGRALADAHYSRRKVGAPQFMPPGETLVLVAFDGSAVFGWWRPHPASGLRSMNGLDGWTCSIFRYERGLSVGEAVWGGRRRPLASTLILEAETMLVASKGSCGPDGLLTYVWDAKVASPNPGYCFKCAGWRVHPKPKSADGKKTLLWKPWDLAGKPAEVRHAA
ncbi:MAG: hypothetical protein KF764_08475 [Labilithrix sp.]|nr:hypothetical protein [Labilithrix sp.]